MHEFGHTFDSRDLGPFYFLVIGLPSIISAGQSKQIDGEINGVTTHKFFWTEMRANKYAKEYFEKYYGVDWNSYYKNHRINDPVLGFIEVPGTIEDFYPTY